MHRVPPAAIHDRNGTWTTLRRLPRFPCPSAPPSGPPARAWGERGSPREPVGARPGGTVSCESGGALLSHTLSGAVPSPCRALASGFGMGPGVSPWPWPPQILSTFPGTSRGDRTVTVREPDNGREKSLVTHSGRSLPSGIIRRTQYGPPPGTRMMEYDCLSPVSTGQLHPLRGFHVRPIDHVFYMGGRAARGREES